MAGLLDLTEGFGRVAAGFEEKDLVAERDSLCASVRPAMPPPMMQMGARRRSLPVALLSS